MKPNIYSDIFRLNREPKNGRKIQNATVARLQDTLDNNFDKLIEKLQAHVEAVEKLAKAMDKLRDSVGTIAILIESGFCQTTVEAPAPTRTRRKRTEY